MIDNMMNKLPPHNIMLEESVIGEIIYNENDRSIAIEYIRDNVDVFYDVKNRYIYKYIIQMYKESLPIDLVTFVEYLISKNKLKNVGGEENLIRLSKYYTYFGIEHIEHKVLKLIEYYIKRKSGRVGYNLMEMSYSEEVQALDMLSSSYTMIDEVSNFLKPLSNSNFSDTVDTVVSLNKNENTGVMSPINKINDVTNGWQDGELIIIAARPGMGKTAFVLNQAKFTALKNIGVGIFSLEMGSKQLVTRLICDYSNIEGDKMKFRRISKDVMDRMKLDAIELKKLPIFIDDTPALSVMELKLKAKKWKRDNNIGLLIVDYLQLMKSNDNKTGNREQEISEISRGLKAIAKELDIPVIALSQLSRSVETRGGNKRPLLSDLRESGAIEQDADMVLFLYRPEYYKLDTWDDNEATSCINQAEIIIAKNRNGDTPILRVGCDLRYFRFTNIDSYSNQFGYTPLKPTNDDFVF